MGWENKIVGYKITDFDKEDIIPLDSKFMRTKQIYQGMHGWASNLQPWYKTIYEYQVPIYKKIRTKK